MKSNVELAEVVKRIRLRRDWSQRMLEDRAGIGRGYISILESGVMKSRPKLSTLMKIAQALRVPLVSITGDMDTEESDRPFQTRGSESYRSDSGSDEETEENGGDVELFTLLRDSHPDIYSVLRKIARETIREDQARRRRGARALDTVRDAGASNGTNEGKGAGAGGGADPDAAGQG